MTPSEGASNSESHIDESALVAHEPMSGAFAGEEMHAMEMRAFPSETTGKIQVEGEKVSDVKFHEKRFSAVEVILHMDQVYEIPHPLRNINAEHRRGLETSIRMHGFDFIHGLVVMARLPVTKNGEDIKRLLDDTAHLQGLL